MTTFRQIRTDFSFPIGYGEVGIEIETEAKSPYDRPRSKYWDAKEDGSLRNVGVEYVLIKPLDHNSKEYNEALDEFDAFQKKIKFIDSPYTSVHVHLNMVDRELIHMANFITLYLIFENVLTRYCGPDRDGNLFCLKTKDAEQLYRVYKDLIYNIDQGLGAKHCTRLVSSHIKYSALNIANLRTLGSLEIRTHGGTTDVKEIRRWVDILMCLYNKAQKFSSPVEIVNLFKDKKKNIDLVKLIFGQNADYFSKEHIDNDIDKTLFYAASIATTVKDWSKYPALASPKPLFKNRMVSFNTASFDEIDATEGMWANANDRQWLLDRLAHYQNTTLQQTIEPVGDM